MYVTESEQTWQMSCYCCVGVLATLSRWSKRVSEVVWPTRTLQNVHVFCIKYCQVTLKRTQIILSGSLGRNTTSVVLIVEEWNSLVENVKSQVLAWLSFLWADISALWSSSLYLNLPICVSLFLLLSPPLLSCSLSFSLLIMLFFFISIVSEAQQWMYNCMVHEA